ncbi:hypothetical protein CHISP_3214 [Chitinispirillum alkaliphilum]|nr:hypothetical protein CHISP_3214 [Chitinispirillum alkaliphilum]
MQWVPLLMQWGGNLPAVGAIFGAVTREIGAVGITFDAVGGNLPAVSAVFRAVRPGLMTSATTILALLPILPPPEEAIS